MRTGNHLLDALPSSVYERLSADLRPVRLSPGVVLYEAGDPIESIYFPVDCIVSMTHDLANGDTVEQALIGHEGFVGTSLIMGGTTMPSRKVAQSRGCAYRLPAKVLKAEFDRHGELHDVLLRFVQSLFVQVAQTAVCNRHHSVEQQLCRWLLLAVDRLADDQLAITQKLIADMLGVRREGVTLAAGRLQRQGQISCSRGVISVLDRPLLEQYSCECYEVIRTESARLLSAP